MQAEIFPTVDLLFINLPCIILSLMSIICLESQLNDFQKKFNLVNYIDLQYINVLRLIGPNKYNLPTKQYLT